MALKKFEIRAHVFTTIEIDEDALAFGLTDEFRNSYYKFDTVEEVAAHIGYNVLRNDIERLEQLDGFADREGDLLKTGYEDWSDVEAEAV